ncbi:MBL fold metallo-hydrolase [Patescibacteria group bacterium]
MDITYLGHSSFKIKTKTAVLVCDPFDPTYVGLKYSGVEGDIVTISHDHSDHNKAELVKGNKKVVNGPGEYEIMGVSLIGISSFHDTKHGGERGKNTIYVIEADGLRLAHLGDVGHTLSDNILEQIGDIDVLMIPVGGEYTIGPKEVVETVNKIDPYFVIPMHYQTTGLNPQTFSKLEPADTFLKQMGLTVEKSSKFSIKKEEIIKDQGIKIILLEKK